MAANDWSIYAKSYATSSAAQIPEFFANIAAKKLFDCSPTSPIKFLDVASGPGSLTERVLNYASEGQMAVESVIVTDFSAGMVESATEAISSLKNSALVKKDFHVMDAQDLKFDDASFTHLGCMFGIMFFPDRAKGLSEIYRVLQPGGLAVIGTWNSTSAVRIIPDLAVYASLPDVEKGVAMISSVVAICSDPSVFTTELRAVGFTKVEVHVQEQAFVLPNTMDTYMVFANNAVLKKALGGRDAAELYPSWQEYLQGPGKERWLDEDGMIRVHYVANIAVARK